MLTAPYTPPENGMDAYLIAVGQHCDEDAFSHIYEFYSPRIKSFFMQKGAQEDVADDLAQETLITIWNNASSYDPDKSGAATWIYTIARNKFIDSFRKEKKTSHATVYDTEALDQIADDQTTPGEVLEEENRIRTLQNAVDALSQEQKDVIYESFFKGKSHANISQEKKIPLGTVKSRLRLALNALKRNKTIEML